MKVYLLLVVKLIITIVISGSSYSYAISREEEGIKLIVTDCEKKYHIPHNLLWSIAKVESHINPFAIHIAGKAYFPKTSIEAEQIIEAAIRRGITNIDIGLMQVNLKYHGKNFRNIHEMLEVNKNLDYAAILLCRLYKTYGGWWAAVQHYHSSKPEHHLKYARKVSIVYGLRTKL